MSSSFCTAADDLGEGILVPVGLDELQRACRSGQCAPTHCRRSQALAIDVARHDGVVSSEVAENQVLPPFWIILQAFCHCRRIAGSSPPRSPDPCRW